MLKSFSYYQLLLYLIPIYLIGNRTIIRLFILQFISIYNCLHKTHWIDNMFLAVLAIGHIQGNKNQKEFILKID